MPQRKKIEKTKQVVVSISMTTSEIHSGEHVVDVPFSMSDEEIAAFVQGEIDREAIDVWDVVKWRDSETTSISAEVKHHIKSKENAA